MARVPTAGRAVLGRRRAVINGNLEAIPLDIQHQILAHHSQPDESDIALFHLVLKVSPNHTKPGQARQNNFDSITGQGLCAHVGSARPLQHALKLSRKVRGPIGLHERDSLEHRLMDFRAVVDVPVPPGMTDDTTVRIALEPKQPALYDIGWPPVTILFRDCRGRAWKRLDDGRLEEFPGDMATSVWTAP